MAIFVRTLLGAAALALWISANAAQAQPLTLDAALQTAFANNPDLAAAQWEIDIAEGGRQQAGLIPLNAPSNALATPNDIASNPKNL